MITKRSAARGFTSGGAVSNSLPVVVIKGVNSVTCWAPMQPRLHQTFGGCWSKSKMARLNVPAKRASDQFRLGKRRG